MEKYATLLQSKIVVWFIYHGNDLYENLVPNMRIYRMPFIRKVESNGSWEIITQHVNSSKWQEYKQLDYLQVLAEICTPSLLHEKSIDACEELIKRAGNIISQRNAKLVVVSLPDLSQMTDDRNGKLRSLSPNPHKFDPYLPDRKLKQICDDLSVPFYTLKDYLTADNFINDDVHWNEEGHRKVAELLSSIYNTHSITLKNSVKEPV